MSGPGLGMGRERLRDADEIVRRRFGSLHDKPCHRPDVLTCAVWECQVRNECRYAKPAGRLALQREP